MSDPAGTSNLDSPGLRELVARGDHASLLDARDLALTMSVSAVRGELDYDLLDEHAESASRFFRLWLDHLAWGGSGFEQMAVADWVGAEHGLSMVHVDRAYGIGAAVTVDALARVSAQLADTLTAFRFFTDGPDAEVDAAVADRFGRLAGTLAAVHAEIAEEAARLPAELTEPPVTPPQG